MDKFEEFVKESHGSFKTNVEGYFECQICDEEVFRAYNDREGSMLIWKCAEGHISKIKDFYI